MTETPAWLLWPQTRQLVAAFAGQPGCLRFVGGAVRDALLGREVLDVDAATTLLPEATMALLERSAIRVIPTGLSHGTVTAVVGGKSYEITTLRRDVTTDGRHAEVAFTDDWQVDASRRDFTMNAVYVSPEGQWFDYFGGADDAKAGRVRFIGDAGKRIGEEYLRILRFFRFYAYYGKCDPDEAALAACAANAASIATLSGERVQHELSKLLKATGPAPTLQLMHANKLLPYVLGFGVADLESFDRFDAIARQERLSIPYPVRLAGFVLKAQVAEEDAFTRLAGRLKLSNPIERSLHIVLQAQRQVAPELAIAGQKRLIRALGGDDFGWAVVLNWAHGNEAIAESHPYHAMLQLAESWTPPKFPVNGDDLIALGIKPGKTMGELLGKLEEKWEASDYTLTKDELLGL